MRLLGHVAGALHELHQHLAQTLVGMCLCVTEVPRSGHVGQCCQTDLHGPHLVNGPSVLCEMVSAAGQEYGGQPLESAQFDR